MTKIKTTRKHIVETTAPDYLIAEGYCCLTDLLRNHEPVAYTCGVYGWNFDVYEVYGLTICTGYRGMPGRSVDDLCEANKRAREIMEGAGTYEQRMNAIEDLLRETCEKIING